MKPYACWHYHHAALMEFVTESIADRIAFNRRDKPKDQLATRERLIGAVKGKLPIAIVKAWEAYAKAGEAYAKAREAYDKAREAYAKAWVACEKAWEAYDKALSDHMPEILALHAKECPDCPWDGKTIFPETRK